jgi:hypothetical protein
MQLASEHVLDLFAAFSLPCSPGAAACMVSNAAGDAAGRPALARESAMLQGAGGRGSWGRKGSQYELHKEDSPSSSSRYLCLASAYLQPMLRRLRV